MKKWLSKLIKRFVYLVWGVLLLQMVYAYPVIVTEQGINHTKSVAIVKSIPEKYYKHVDRIDFVAYDWARCKATDNDQQRCSAGWYWAWWNNNHECNFTRIILGTRNQSLYKKTLTHELGHIFEHCELKRDYSSEQFADSFRVE